METAWYENIVDLLGIIGGSTGLIAAIIALYQAKAKKNTLDINNFHSLIEEERTERKNLSQEYHQYKEEVERKVEDVKRDFRLLREDNNKMLIAIYQAYRCKLPERMHECPVIKAFNGECSCDECKSEETIEDMDKLSI